METPNEAQDAHIFDWDSQPGLHVNIRLPVFCRRRMLMTWNRAVAFGVTTGVFQISFKSIMDPYL
jgi:hypothetical protein